MIVVRRSMFIGHRFYRIDMPLELTYNQIVIECVRRRIWGNTSAKSAEKNSTGSGMRFTVKDRIFGLVLCVWQAC